MDSVAQAMSLMDPLFHFIRLLKDPPINISVLNSTMKVTTIGVRSPKFIWAACAHPYSLAETPQPPPPPPLRVIYEGTIGQPIDDISL